MKSYSRLRVLLWLLSGWMLLPACLQAQTYPDSTVNSSQTRDSILRRQESEKRSNSPVVKDTSANRKSVRKATMLSALIPGAGQIYNKKYWKLPILYGAFAGLGYLIHFNNKEYQIYNDALVARLDDNPETIDTEFTDKYSDENLRSLSDYYHRNRDLCIVITVVVYALNVMDAHVDAHLNTFDVSDDLSMKVEPVLLNTSPYMGLNGYKPGLGITLKF